MEKNSRTDFDFDTKGKRLFLGLSTFTLILMMLITTILWWFVSPRLHEINEVLAAVSLTALRIFFFILLLGNVLVMLTSYTGRNLLVAKIAILAYIKILYPVTIFVASILGISKEKIRESYVHVNNSFIRSLKKKLKPSDILLLLPHCLQNSDCLIRLTYDIHKCEKCGKCDIKDLCEIIYKHKIKAAIATGGSLARKIIIENKPKFIIAVACDRDLVDGMREVFPIPIFGVLNQRPEGPCINTKVDTKKIDSALNVLLTRS
ncbi:MAG: DUF116 domain-containing protein [Candidatus Cloacimonetes bacterium]|nr:DUF116 domain-containing protein [Candidatus Cloacimonadota bacterium]MCF7814992.1 DUF116 domain-containing protein [Candidatus Cloacimonadota bacterium]MCF7868408.1 DUF116 domain-containing protein [Candidatus Cloacimonadota bacterium]MCF7883881.1 DUF116 domain-containing protein [Candidatus Cloacimonadota bacterium]